MKTYFKPQISTELKPVVYYCLLIPILLMWLLIFYFWTLNLRDHNSKLTPKEIQTIKDGYRKQHAQTIIIGYEDTAPTIRAIKLYYATLAVETNNYDTSAINDTIHYIKALGWLQITDICRRDANRIVGFEKFVKNSLLSAKESTEIWYLSQCHYNSNFDFIRGASHWISGKNVPKSRYACYYCKKIINLIEKS